MTNLQYFIFCNIITCYIRVIILKKMIISSVLCNIIAITIMCIMVVSFIKYQIRQTRHIINSSFFKYFSFYMLHKIVMKNHKPKEDYAAM